MKRCTNCDRRQPSASYREELDTSPPEVLTHLMCQTCRDECDARSRQTDFVGMINRQAASLGLPLAHTTMKRLPLDVPIALHLSPRILFAVEKLIADPVVADQLEECLALEGVEPDATEDAVDHVNVVIRRALDSAARRPRPARSVTQVEVREVTEAGTVVAGGTVFAHADLLPLAGQDVRCRAARKDGLPVAEISTLAGVHVCMASDIRNARLVAA